MSKHALLEYWPRYEDIVACLKTEAEASSEAVSLAVHQPMRFERSLMGGSAGVIDQCNEHELLEAFFTEHLPEGRVIVPIVGYTGIGKSHVVRWLHAQICRRPGAARRVVIRIPKGMSLKGVLGILLQVKELQGTSYQQFRRELIRAQQELDPREAAGLLCEMLAHTLEEMGAAARTRLTSNPKDKTAQDQEAYCRADFLPSLLRNQHLRDKHFVQTPDGEAGVVKRLVEQLTEERAAGADDDRKHAFVPNDLVFDDRIDRSDLGRAEARTLNQLDREDRRVVAAQILNSALDDAKQRLLRLDPTVSDLFDAVRRELLKEGKELILLFEDFAVLSGLQKQILQVIIKEAIRDGQQVLCTMRTALAYTKGYMQETVLSRANTIYEIPDEPGTADEILDRIKRLVGAYLNAARLGQAKLEKTYLQKAAESEDLRSWVPRFEANVEAETRATLDAFGRSEDGYELFPFNPAAIEQLAREGSTKDGQLVYNPRSIINNVINKVLWFRDQFEEGGFPPARFGGAVRPLAAGVTADVGRRVPPTDLDRYLRFLTYWGGFPSAPSEIASIEPRVFAAFGFDQLLFIRKGAPQDRETPKISSLTSQPEIPKPRFQVSSIETKWMEILERWRGGTQIPQADANQLRKWVAEALKGYIDWDWELFRPRKEGTFDSLFTLIYIPRASGNAGRTADDALTTLCADEDLSDEARSARVYFAIMSIVRFHGVYNGSWDYEKAEEDLPRYAAFLETLSTRARAFLRRRYFKDDWDAIPALVQGLLVGARALGIEGAARDSDVAALINALFAPTPDGSAAVAALTVEADGTNWSQFTESLRICRSTGDKETRHQLSWAGHLLNLVGARQGQADTVHAVDVSRLKPAIEKTLSNWEFTEALPNPLGVAEFGPFRTTYNELKRLSSAITKAQQFLIRWRSEMLVWLGEGVDKEKKETLVRELKDCIEAAKARGLMRGVDSRPLLRLISDFQNAPVVAALQDVEKLNDKTPRGTVLTILGRGYEPVAVLCANLQDHLEKFFQSVEAELQSESIKYGDNPLIEATGALVAELEKTGCLLKELK